MKKILFVCVENSNRSQMAEAFAIINGKDKVEAFSAGSEPSGKVNEKAIESMKELGYNLTEHFSKSLKDFEGEEFDYLITMGCGDECPYVSAKHREDWQIPQPKDMDKNEFRKVRDEIEKKVKGLIAQIEK